MHRMNSIDPLHDKAAELIKAAQAFHSAADQTGIRRAVPLSLARTEEALQLLSGAWYQLAGDASPRIASRSRQLSEREADPSEIDNLSHEQEARLIATLHDVAAAFAHCARTCREGRLAVAPALATSGGRSIPFGERAPRKQRVA
jgi:hypothetical protein